MSQYTTLPVELEVPHLRLIRDDGGDRYDAGGSTSFVPVAASAVHTIGPRVGPRNAWVYVVLASFTRNETGKCHPSIDTIAERAGMSNRTIERAISDLEAAGLITCRQRYSGRGVQLTTEYTIVDHPMAQKPRNQWGDKPSDNSTDNSTDNCTDNCTDKPSDNSTVESVTQTIENYRELDSTTSLSPDDEKRERLRAGFSRFATAYPKGMDDDAKRAWAELDPDEATITAILDSIPLWIESDEWQRESGRYKHKPSTWLRDRKWTITPVSSKLPTARDHMTDYFRQIG